jgi:hypothetical protein
MTAPAASFAQLPTDSGNTGKKIRTQTKTVGADTVHEHFFVPSSTREKLGRYIVHSGVNVISATAHTFGTSGFMWVANPVANTAKIAICEIEIITQLGSALVAVTSPRLLWSTFTFTGTASGASLTPGKFDSTFAAATASVRTAVTGMTTVKVADTICSLPIASATAVGYAPPSLDESVFEAEEQQIILRPGEGICLWQADAGTTADTRRTVTTVIWEEFN